MYEEAKQNAPIMINRKSQKICNLNTEYQF